MSELIFYFFTRLVLSDLFGLVYLFNIYLFYKTVTSCLSSELSCLCSQLSCWSGCFDCAVCIIRYIFSRPVLICNNVA